MTTATTRIQHASGLSERVRGFFGGILDALLSISEVRRRAAEAERMMALSDRRLAELGLKRDEIVHHVFRDYLDRWD